MNVLYGALDTSSSLPRTFVRERLANFNKRDREETGQRKLPPDALRTTWQHLSVHSRPNHQCEAYAEVSAPGVGARLAQEDLRNYTTFMADQSGVAIHCRRLDCHRI